MDTEEEPQQQKATKAPLLISVAAASVLGALFFSLTYSGLILPKANDEPVEQVEEAHIIAEPLPALQFIPIEPLMVSLGSAANGKQLRFEGYLEVNPAHLQEVSDLMPRIMDVLNTYLRAVDYSDIEEPTSLLKLRLQMLRRVQIVVGDGRVNDLLVSKFLLS